MRNVLIFILSLFSAIGVAQKSTSLEAFDALDSDIGANIHIIRSEGYGISVSGDEELLKHIQWTVKDRNLEIRTDGEMVGLEDVMLTVHTTTLEVLKVSNGGKATMDASFTRLEEFEVTADSDAIVDLSKIEFRTLVANSKNGGQIIYNDPSDPF
jgi:hypothetical protein